MFDPKYFFRVDDVHDRMDWSKFERVVKIFDEYKIKAIIGVIPDNCDETIVVDQRQANFWQKIRELSEKGWVLALHGFRHMYENKNAGLLKINNKSEFAGISPDEQKKRMETGILKLQEMVGVTPRWWMAPAHSFDDNTCVVLRDLGFTHITDGVGIFPFYRYGLIWLPQQMWRPRKKPFGYWTICLHTNTMSENDFLVIETFVRRNSKNIASPVDISAQKDPIINKIFRLFWYFQLFIYRLITK